jgi:uncharacterized damage-inducible protein DinB
MSSVASLQTLMHYKAWANQMMFSRLAELPEEALLAERQTLFGNMLHTLNHVYAMDTVWQAHLQGRAHGLESRNPSSRPSFVELRDAQARMDEWFIAYADSLNATVSDEIVTFTFIGGGEGAMTRADILQHVVTHGVYHRGHVAGMMYQVPAKPPTTDFPVFLRDRS